MKDINKDGIGITTRKIEASKDATFRLTLPVKKLEKLKHRADGLKITSTELINEVLDSYLIVLGDIETKALKNPEFYTPDKILEESYKI